MMNIKNICDSETFPRKYAFLLASDAIGGAERFFFELAIAMQHTSTKPVVINLKSKIPYKEELRKNDVTVIDSVASSKYNIIGYYKLYKLLKNINPDALIINGNRQALIIGTILSRLLRIPVTLIHTHAHNRLYRKSINITSRFVDKVIAASETHRSYLIKEYGLNPNNVTFIYPGIALDRTASNGKCKNSFYDSSEKVNVPTVGIIAALRPVKDHENFLHAAAYVCRKIRDIRFIIVGDGVRRAKLESLARQIGVNGKIQFLGWQIVDNALFNQLDILTLSSYSETFPAVIIEAFSSGTPVVSTDVGSIRELIVSRKFGILVPPRDPIALGEAIITIIQDIDMAKEMSIMGLRRAQYYSADRFCKDILKITTDINNQKQSNTIT